MANRGQAYTLEGVFSAIVVLTAVLFALQSVIITPTTSGSVDPAVRSELRHQADDILLLSAQNESFSLSAQVRYWDQSAQTFAGPNASSPRVGYGDDQPPGAFGTMLNRTFTQRGRLYNVEIRYRGQNLSDGPGRVPMVFRGTPGEGAVVATHSLTLYDNQTLTGPVTGDAELWEYDTNATDNDDGYYPVPNAVDGPIYNVVEVRVVVW